jgi:hypothetical protein
VAILLLLCSQPTTNYDCSLRTNYFGRSGKLLLALASKIILGSEPHGTHEHTLLSHNSGSHPASLVSWCLLYSLGADHIETTTSYRSAVVACVFVAMETCSPCRYLAAAIASCSTIPAFSHHVTMSRRGMSLVITYHACSYETHSYVWV